jgi:hypothetical protein
MTAVQDPKWDAIIALCITPEQAKERNMISMTTPYPQREMDMLRRAVADMRGCSFALVRFTQGVEIWRGKAELITES